ncbi:MAG: hypothetical protein M9887_01900 [Chitinophagales bacterium]|nr:hypothetical protein [Chitinophagales bacterium]
MQKLQYIHHNPIQEHWQLVKDFKDYKWSSAEFYESGKDIFEIIHDIGIM